VTDQHELDPFDLPPPDSDQHEDERRRKFVVGVVRHNEPCSTTQLRLVYCRHYDRRTFGEAVRRAMDNDDIARRSPEGFEAADYVR